ncbi:MAG: redox-regulated ATPase YchF [Nitrospinota bacterium]
MRVGIIGLPGSGKTTLFNALTGASAPTGDFGSGGTHRAVAQVPDARLDFLGEAHPGKKVIHATVEYVDEPALGEEAGRRRPTVDELPEALKVADALLLVVRAFEDPRVPHPRGRVDPLKDCEDAQLDLILRDLAVIEKRRERISTSSGKAKREEDAQELELLKRLSEELEAERPLRACALKEEEVKLLRGFGFLSAKPLLIAVNTGEEELRAAGGKLGGEWEALSGKPLTSSLSLCAKLEMELSELEPEERREFLEDFDLKELALTRVLRDSYRLLGLISFFTIGKEEVRAWSIPEGTRALKAAGQVHSDMERGFIKAEVVAFDDFRSLGSMAAVREKGLLRLEGKDYPVRDGDIIQFRFHV